MYRPSCWNAQVCSVTRWGRRSRTRSRCRRGPPGRSTPCVSASVTMFLRCGGSCPRRTATPCGGASSAAAWQIFVPIAGVSPAGAGFGVDPVHSLAAVVAAVGVGGEVACQGRHRGTDRPDVAYPGCRRWRAGTTCRPEDQIRFNPVGTQLGWRAAGRNSRIGSVRTGRPPSKSTRPGGRMPG